MSNPVNQKIYVGLKPLEKLLVMLKTIIKKNFPGLSAEKNL